ncbi:MAG: TRAP transporter substrate-binding protein [Marinagarivorans sp.]|nr:TRAP transporter substrate-binding protein [Marinagarivorans sp.]
MTTVSKRIYLPSIIALLLIVIVLLMGLLIRQNSHSVSSSNTGVNDAINHQKNTQIYHWTLVTTWPKNFPGIGAAPENFANLLRKISSGRLDITVYGANEIVPAMGVFGAVSSGSAQMGHGAAYYWRGKIPAAVFFSSVPFGMNVQELNGWLHYGGGMELWREIYAPHNLVPFAGGNTGVQMGGWFNKPINSLADIQGLKMRIPGLGGDVFTRAGGTAVNIPGGELYTALQSGVIDATEWVGPYNDLAFGFHQIAKYYYYPGWQEPGPALEFTVNKEAYDSLPDDLKIMIETAARAINQDMLDEYTARNKDSLVELIEKYHVDVRPFPNDVLQSFAKISEDIYQENAATDPQFKKIYDSYKIFLEKIRPYHDISEKAYYDFRP